MAASLVQSVMNYRVAWISALPIERASAMQMLDEEHEEPIDFNRHEEDHNSYDWGRVNGHNIVLTSLPVASYGKVNATTCVSELLSSLPQIKFGLLVGIGAGLPNDQNDIRLGDVVVSQPDQSHGGVIQYDLGKAVANGTWEPKGFLNPPPRVLLNALGKVKAKHECGDFQHIRFLDQAMKKNTYWGAHYGYPVSKADRLFSGKRRLNDNGELERPPRSSKAPCIHFGTIASGDTLVKDEVTRNAIPEKIKQTCLCVEMEAAGLMNKFPCLVIRGISDYADCHKTDHWQRYASATAAAFAKEVLSCVPVNELKHSQNAIDHLESQATLKLLKNQFLKAEHKLREQKIENFLRDLYTCPYADRKDRNIEALDGTCQWFIGHSRFMNFVQNPEAKLLWVSADPGCGKSVLTRYLVDKILNINEDKIICYFFFKDDFLDQNRSVQAMSAMLRQLVCADPGALEQTILDKYTSSGRTYMHSFQNLWKAFLKTAANSAPKSIVCVFDALDECQSADRHILIRAISEWHRANASSNLKILATSRPYYSIKDDFYDLIVNHPNIHLSGEDEVEAREIAKEIDIVLRHRIRLLCKRRHLTVKEENVLIDKFVSIPQRTYLWAYLTMDLLESTPGLTTGRIKNILANLPVNVEQAYERILNRSPDYTRTRLILHILLAAQRPLTVEEVSIAFTLTAEWKDFQKDDEDIEVATRFERTVRELCGLFVFVKDLCVYFLHQTAREFLSTKTEFTASIQDLDDNSSQAFSWSKTFHPYESHRRLAERCLWFLSLSDSALYNKSFFEYCNQYWVLHFRKGEFGTDSLLNTLAIAIFQRWSSSYWLLPQHTRDIHKLMGRLSELTKRSIPAIFFASWFGLTCVIQTLLEFDPSIRDRKDVMYSALSLACQAGNNDAAKALLVCSTISYQKIHHLLLTQEQEHPLITACRTFNVQLCYLLLRYEFAIVAINEAVRPNGYDPFFCYGETPLHLACPGYILGNKAKPFGMHDRQRREYSLEIIRTLVKLGANIEARTETGAMPIHYFLSRANLILDEDNREALNRPEFTSLTSLHAALQLLLPPGTDVNEHDDIAGASLMGFAAWSGSAKLIQAMLMMGGSIHVRDQAGNSLLHYVVVNQNDGGAIEFALSMGLNIESRNNDDLTALSLAAARGSYQSCKALISSGANVEARDRKGRTPLMHTLKGGHLGFPVSETWLEGSRFRNSREITDNQAIIDSLIEAGADVNMQDLEGNACIHYVASNLYREDCFLSLFDDYRQSLFEAHHQSLFEAHADVNLTNRAGQTALHLLADRCVKTSWDVKSEILALLEHSADPSIVDNNGRNALSYIEEGLRELVMNGQQGNIFNDQGTKVKKEVMECLVLLKYGPGTQLDSLAGEEEFGSYLKHTFEDCLRWMKTSV